MEWNSARLKWNVLNGTPSNAEPTGAKKTSDLLSNIQGQSFMKLCKFGLALNWPILLMGLATVLMAVILMFKK
jgi:hypothetical protein